MPNRVALDLEIRKKKEKTHKKQNDIENEIGDDIFDPFMRMSIKYNIRSNRFSYRVVIYGERNVKRVNFCYTTT